MLLNKAAGLAAKACGPQHANLEQLITTAK